MSEHDEQVLFFQWVSWNLQRYPELSLMFAIPNGGKRHISIARKLKAEGVKAGVPDIFLPAARGEFHGLFIEMKTARGSCSRSQISFGADLVHAGYCVCLCHGFAQAIEKVKWYLESAK